MKVHVSDMIKHLQGILSKHGDIEFWAQIHLSAKPNAQIYGERFRTIGAHNIPGNPGEVFPPVCILEMNTP